MGFYSRYILPRVIHWAMRHREASLLRERWIPLATGRVLEIGVGSGLNFPYYSSGVEAFTGIDSSSELLALARERASSVKFPVKIVQTEAEGLEGVPLASFDTVVMTWTLCSIRDPGKALRSISKRLKVGGRLLFIEHGLASGSVARSQCRLTPIWRRFTGGCHLDRRADRLLLSAGYQLQEFKIEEASGPRLLSTIYQGIAVPPAPIP